MCISSLIVIHNTINQLETNVSLITIYCLRLCIVVYKHVTLYIVSKVMLSYTCVSSLIVIDTTINQLETNVSINNNVLPEAICCCLQ